MLNPINPVNTDDLDYRRGFLVANGVMMPIYDVRFSPC